MIKKRRQQNETVISVKLVTAKGLTMEFFYQNGYPQKGYPQKGYRLKVQRGNLSYQKGYRQADIVKMGIN